MASKTQSEYDKLVAALEQPSFTARTDAELQQAAENKYASYYDQLNQAAQQAYDRTALAYQNQLNNMLPTYANQMDEARLATTKAMSNAGRNALARGMGRSTYNLATMANINLQGNKTLDSIQQALTNAQNTANSQSAQAAEQLAQTLAGYQKNQASDMLSYIDAQKQSDYEKELAAMQYRNELLLQLYGLKPKTSSSGTSNKKQTNSQTTTQITEEELNALLGLSGVSDWALNWGGLNKSQMGR